ncbi:MAG: hypothetical protein ACLFVP_00815 [Candidatus Bathyarchaeia archaeon]
MPQYESERIVEGIKIKKTRRLPIKGSVLVKEGETVTADTVIAKGTVENPDIREVNVFSQLEVDPEDIKQYMLKEEGRNVKKDEVIAIHRSFFGRRTVTSRSPIEGTIERISTITGKVLIRGKPIHMEIKAHIPGRVSKIIPEEGAIIETKGTLIEGVFGLGGERYAPIKMAVDRIGEPLTTDRITSEDTGEILVGGSIVSLEALRKASEMGVKGVITGSIDQKDLTDFLGYELGMGITGEEDIKFSLILTEGFGVRPLEEKIFKSLHENEGKYASIDGSTQIRSRMIRPQIIISNTKN